MESRDMFALQKKYFIDCLESAIQNNYKKVTFIHGVGNGILKNAIIKILKDYENVENQSASISKFGLGAIDVLIKPWE
jgi:dsDNA-specific endonuclease/ATPase MutS2